MLKNHWPQTLKHLFIQDLIYKSVLLNYVQTVSNPKHFIGENPVGLVSTRKSLGMFWQHLCKIFENHNITLSEEDMAMLPRFMWHQFIVYLYIFCINDYDKEDQKGFINYTVEMISKMVK